MQTAPEPQTMAARLTPVRWALTFYTGATATVSVGGSVAITVSASHPGQRVRYDSNVH